MGSHTWNDLQDWGANGTLVTFDYAAYVNFLQAHGHNFTLVWATELPRFCGFPTGASTDFVVSPQPWIRSGPGTGTDGGLKFDLHQPNQPYFDRLRSRVLALGAAGIYAGVYIFTGEWLNVYRCPTDGYPLTSANNVNGINDGGGTGSVTMSSPNAITAIQDDYVRTVIDTLNDLPNVLWIVSEEAPANSIWWNNHLIGVIDSYEATKPYRHPIGYGAPLGSESSAVSSDADWIAPLVRISPPTTCGTGSPPCKVNINDSDHSYFGMWNDSAQANRNYAWQNFTNGNQVVFMDPYVVYYPRENRNLCPSPVNGICPAPDARWDNFRDNLGYILSYARKLNLANVTPRSSLCSTGNCLAQTPPVGAEYLVYAPIGGSFTVNLSAMSSARTLNVEWLNPSSGATVADAPIAAGSASQAFTPPFGGDAVLYLVDAAGHAEPPPAPPSLSYAIGGLWPGTYRYRVRAADAAGNLGPYSNEASATVVSSDPSDVTLTKTHVGNFMPGQTGATYLLIVTNSGLGPTSDPVTVTETVPAGLTATGIGGSDWACTQPSGPCTQSALLEPLASYPPLTLTVDVAANAPASVTNTATVSGGGESNTANDTANDLTLMGPADTGLVASYAFEEGTGASVLDASGSGNTGTIAGATRTTSGKYGSALSFNGTSAVVTVNDAPSLDLTTGMTLEAWAKPAAATTEWRDVIYKGPNDTYYLEGSSTQSSRPATNGYFSSGPLLGPTALPLATWSHLAAIYDGALLALYVNGARVASRAQTGAIAPSTGPLTIGGDATYGQFWSGLIDEVRIYNRALASAELQEDMAAPGVCGILGGSLHVAANKQTISWLSSVVTGPFDVVKGDLIYLRSSGGDFTGASCLANGVKWTTTVDPAAPAPGGATYYLMRCDRGTWADGTQSGNRDATLVACP